MPISIVVGGQYGSEGKGKVALDLVRRDPSITIVVRPGGTNSGHTGYSRDGRRLVLRQLPAAAIDRNVRVVFPAGSYIDVDLLLREIAEVGLAKPQIAIDPRAQIIRPEHISWESEAGLSKSIGSTNSGTGAAVISRIARFARQHPLGISVSEVPELAPYISDAAYVMGDALEKGERLLVEGTQGFGLSVLHSDNWPQCTSRDTTAAGFLSEAGLSPLHVDQIILVIRCHPIRVAGDSGPLLNETNWEAVGRAAGASGDLREFTSVTHKLRRVGLFDAELVKKAIASNSPTSIVLNHLDYIDWTARDAMTEKALNFVQRTEQSIQRPIDWIGLGPSGMIKLNSQLVSTD